MLKHSKKTPANKKKVRYGPVRYVNLKFDEPTFTNTYQISELCQKCGTVRSVPNIDEGCKNCSVPKPSGSLFLDKKEFMPRAQQNFANIQKSNFKDDNQNLVSKNFELKQIIKANSEENGQDHLDEEKQKLHSHDEISILPFENKIKLLEKNFIPREIIKAKAEKNQEVIDIEKKSDSKLVNKNNESEKKNFSYNNEIQMKKTPRTIRNLYKNEQKFEKSEMILTDFDKKSIEKFENKLKFFENKNSSILNSTRSLDSFEPKSIFVETYQTNADIKKREYSIFGSKKSLNHSHFKVDNLNDIPKLLKSISKTSIQTCGKDMYQPSTFNQENIAENVVPRVKPRKNLVKISNEEFKENLSIQHSEIRPKQRQKIDYEKHFEKCNSCKACGEAIKDECIEAEGFYWHLNHFCCSECKCFLADKKYLVSNSNFICLSCHQTKYLKICQTCKLGLDIKDTRFTYEKLDWHSNPNCFKCYKCCKNLCDVPFLIKKNRLFCSMNCKKIFFDN